MTLSQTCQNVDIKAALVRGSWNNCCSGKGPKKSVPVHVHVCSNL